MSMLKRRQGSYVHGRTYHSQCRDLHLLALTHNIMILLRRVVFYRAVLTPFSEMTKKGRAIGDDSALRLRVGGFL
jgi:hypothetical protein